MAASSRFPVKTRQNGAGPMLRIVVATLLAGAFSIPLWAEELKSGLAVGEMASTPFHVKDVTGRYRDLEEVCYRCAYGNRPVISVFTRTIDEDVAKLVKEVDALVKRYYREKRLSAFVVYLSDERAQATAELAAFAKKYGLSEQVPLTVYADAKGPQAYKIAPQAELTVLMWERTEVKVNRALAKDQLRPETIKEIIAQSPKILD